MSSSTAGSADQPVIVLIGSYLVALVMDVDRLPIRGETLLGRNFRKAYGGKGSDMAVQAARLGAPVQFVGCVGDDDFGREFINLMHEEGVNVDLLNQRAELATGAGFIIKSTDGHNIITIDIGANQLLSKADVDSTVPFMKPPSVVLIQLEIPLETALHAAQRGHENHCTVILNPAPAYDLRQSDLSTVDLLTPNETEARVCLALDPCDPTDDIEIARRLLKLGCRIVVMTLGERGCLIVTPDNVTPVPAFSLPNVIDSNGAGDSFNAALATALLEGESLPEAARFANAVAGLCCTRWDTVPSYNTREEVEAFLKLDHQ
jgi:ribokinase